MEYDKLYALFIRIMIVFRDFLLFILCLFFCFLSIQLVDKMIFELSILINKADTLMIKLL